MRLQRRLDRWTTNAGLDTRGPAGRVDLEDTVEQPQIEADDAGILATDNWLDASDNGGAAPEGNDGDICPARPVKHGAHIRLACRKCDEVWCVGEVAAKRTNRLRIGLPISVQEPLIGIARE